MNIPDGKWLSVKSVSFAESLVYLKRASICIIPFPKMTQYLFSFPIKFLDYCAAGKPVLTMDLPEIASYVRKYDCGFVFENYEEMKELIGYCYFNRHDLIRFGKNARAMIEKELSWRNAIEEFRNIILLLETGN
jgi:glycosyltransferase involved in cell wall biosynthesis